MPAAGTSAHYTISQAGAGKNPDNAPGATAPPPHHPLDIAGGTSYHIAGTTPAGI